MSIQLLPRIVTSSNQASLALTGLTPGQPYRISILPLREKDSHLDYQTEADSAGKIAWEQAVPWSGEAILDLYAGEHEPVASLRLYAVPQELAGCYPARCDFHIHTTHSDGHSSVAEMVIRGRALGLDALAITDHNQYEPSQEAIAFVQRLGLGIIPFSGEEVTSRTWHMLSIGANAPVGYTPEQAGYDGMRKTMDMIHARGGKAFLAHPYWVSGRRFNQPVEEYERLLREGGLDGIELFGEVLWEDNLRSMVRYGELDTQDKLPILGNSDTHWMEHTYGSYYTVAFARSLTQADIMTAILDRNAVACMRMPMEPASHPIRSRLLAFGPFELTDLVLFLHEHYYPRHDVLCQEEADLALRCLRGEQVPETAFQAVQAELAAYDRQFWGRR